LGEERERNQATITDLIAEQNRLTNQISQLESLLDRERTTLQTEITNLKE